MLPERDRLGQSVPSPDRPPSLGIRILDVDMADVARIIAQIERLQPVTTRNQRAKPGLEIVDGEETDALMDMLLAKKRSPDRKNWLEDKGDMALL